MSTLTKCLERAGLGQHEAAIIKGRVEDYRNTDALEAHVAAREAVDDYLARLEAYRAEIVRQVAEQGGQVAELAEDPFAPTAIERARDEIDHKPTPGQAAAGNYQHGHILGSELNPAWAPLDITLENAQGSTRSGTDPNGKPWTSTLAQDYGYFKGVQGADKDHLDVFIGPNHGSNMVFVVDQNHGNGRYDEAKVMLGFPSEAAARAGYLANYQNVDMTGRIRAITPMTIGQFKEWIDQGDTTKPAAEASNRFKVGGFEVHGLDMADLKAIAAPFEGLGGNSFNFADTWKDVPAHLQDAAQRFGATDGHGITGLFDPNSGNVWLVRSNLKSADRATKTILHEYVAHYGLRQLLGDELTPVLKTVYASRQKEIQRAASTGILRGYNFDFRAEKDQLIAAEEFIAHQAENGQDQTLVQRFVAAVRRGLKALGFNLEFSDADILDLLRRSRENLRGAGRGEFAIGDGALLSLRDLFGSKPEAAPVTPMGDVEGKPGSDFHGDGAQGSPGRADTGSRSRPAVTLSDPTYVGEALLPNLHESSILNDGKAIGSISLAFSDGKPIALANIKVDKAEERQGYAEAAFLEALQASPNGELYIVNIQPESVGFWQKMGVALDEGSEWAHGNALATQAGYEEARGETRPGAGEIQGRGTAEAEAAPALKGEVLLSLSPSVRDVYGTQNNAVRGYARKAGGAWEVYLATGPTLVNPANAQRLQAANLNEVKRIFNTNGLDFSVFRPEGVSLPNTTLFEPFAVPEHTFWNEFVQKFQNRMKRLGVIQGATRVDESSNAYMHEEVYHGRSAGRLEDFEHDMMDPLVDALVELKDAMPENGPFLQRLKSTVPVLKRLIPDLRFDELKAAGLWLYARHAPERNAAMAELNPDRPEKTSGMSDAEAAAIMAQFDAAGLTPKMQAIAAIVDKINTFRLNELVDSGLMSLEAKLLMEGKYSSYVPLRGRDDIDEDRLRTGRGFDIRGKEISRALGRSSQADPSLILAYVVAQAQTSIIRGEKNQVGQSFMRLVQANPNPEIWEINRVDLKPYFDKATGEVVYGPDPFAKQEDNVFSVKVDGKQHYITIYDEPLARAMKNYATTAPEWTRLLGTITQYFSMINTAASPEFVLTNFLRDLQTAGFNLSADGKTKLAAKVLADIPSAMRGVWLGQREHGPLPANAPEWQKWYREFVQAGGKIGFMDMRTVESRAKQLATMIRDASPSAMRKILLQYPKAIGEFIFDVNGAVENAVRLSAYANARQMGVSAIAAASLSRNLTVNFNRKGELGSAINALYAFYNASVQGSATTVRFMASKKGLALALALAAFGAGLDWLNRLIGGKDRDGKYFWDKVPAYERERNLVVMDPFKEGARFKIPLAYGWNAPFVIGTETAAVMSGGRKPTAAGAQVFKAIMGAFNPLGSDQIAQMLSPTIVDPFLQHALNQDFAGRAIKPEPKGFGPTPPESEQFWPRTPAAYVNFARFLNEASGGNEVRSGKIDVSPNVMQHYLRSFTGGAGQFWAQVGTGVHTMATEGEMPPAREIPFVRKVYAEDTGSELHKGYYERLNSVRQAVEEIKHYGKKGEMGTVGQAMQDHRRELDLYQQAQALDRSLSELRRGVRELRTSPMPADMKKARIKVEEEAINERMKQFVLRYDQVMEPN